MGREVAAQEQVTKARFSVMRVEMARRQVAAQGSADFVTSFASGAGALASGFVFTMAGFHVLSMVGMLASGLVLVLTFYRRQTARLAVPG